MTTVVYLIRHGATAVNREIPNRLQGKGIDLPLDPIGREQAARAAEALASHPLRAVYASPMLRALETASIVAVPHGLAPIPVEDIIEADVGRWEGLTWAEASAQDPEQHDQFHANPGTVPYPGGESFQDVQRRSVPALAALAASHAGERIAVIAHNVVNRAVLASLLGLPIDLARALRQSNCGINVLHYHRAGRVELFAMNACLHLEGLEPGP
ncbi:histidine phosphatase family protein [Isosphaeraceae bacterium EP7]